MAQKKNDMALIQDEPRTPWQASKSAKSWP